MKMTKKVLIGAVAAVALIAGFTGCNFMDSVGHHKLGETKSMKFDNSTYDAGKGVWKIDGTNDGDEAPNYLRGIDCLITKHFDMSAVIDFTPDADGKYTASDVTDGNIGVVLDASKTKEEDEEGNKIDVWEFLNIGVRYNSNASKAQAYVSYFENVKNNDELKSNGSFGKETNITLDNKGKTWIDLGNIKSVAVSAKQQDNGGYEISFYKAEEVFSDSMQNDLKTEGVAPIETVSVRPDQVGKAENPTKTQEWCGAYVNICKGHTLEGKLQIVNLTKSPVDFE